MKNKMLDFQMGIAGLICFSICCSPINAQEVPPWKGNIQTRPKISEQQIVIKSIQVTPAYLDRLAKSKVQLPSGFSSQGRSQLSQIIYQINIGNISGAQDRWHKFVSDLATGGIPMDINAFIQHILRESYLEMTRDLQFFASKVRHFNNLKKKMRNHLKEIRSTYVKIQKYRSPQKTANINVVTCVPTRFSSKQKLVMTRQKMNKRELENYIRSFEEELATLGEDAQLANIDLQNMLQKQQQTIQMMSNISKILHDTALAVIRKIG